MIISYNVIKKFFFMLFMYSPVEQFINFPVFSFNLIINNVVFYIFISAFLILFLGNLISNRIITSNWGLLSESLFRTILF